MRPRHPALPHQTLRELRDLVRAVVRQRHKVVPVKTLAALGAAKLPGTVTIDVAATDELGMPLLVLSPRASRALARLAPREREIATLIAEGLVNKEIADRLGLTVGTVKTYVHRIIEKTGLPNRAAIAAGLAGRPSRRPRRGA